MNQFQQLDPYKKVSQDTRKKVNPVIPVLIIITMAGVTTGYLLSRNISGKESAVSPETAKTGKASDKSISGKSLDTTEGQLEAGGIEGEGTHKLVRPGGPSQNVYLTSSSVDLSSYEGKKVKVSGETMAGNKAGWLMDVMAVEILN